MRDEYTDEMVNDVIVQFEGVADILYLAMKSLAENQKIEAGINYPEQAEEIAKAKNVYLENMFRASIWTRTKSNVGSDISGISSSATDQQTWNRLVEAFRKLAIRFDQWEEAKRAKEAGPEEPAEEAEES